MDNSSPGKGQCLYYSSLKGDEESSYKSAKPGRTKSPTSGLRSPSKRNDAHLFSSPQNPMKSTTSAISHAVSSSIHWVQNKVPRWTISRKLFLSPPCVSSPNANKIKSRSRYFNTNEDVTPMMFYVDEDTNAKKYEECEVSFLDPFENKAAFVLEPKYESPTSVIVGHCFEEQEETEFQQIIAVDDNEEAIIISAVHEGADPPQQLFQFDCPMPPRKLAFHVDENTSIEISEEIKSINATSTRGGSSTFSGSYRAKSSTGKPPLKWEGFSNSTTFQVQKWDPTHIDRLEAKLEEKKKLRSN